jgi:hypothetical protein
VRFAIEPGNPVRRRERDPVKYVSVLTPPLLVCAVFIIAVIAFLRHEMGGRRKDAQEPPGNEIPDDDPIPCRDGDTLDQEHDTSDLTDDK